MEAFDTYCSLLKDRLVAVRKATQQAADFLMQDGQGSTADENIQHPCLSFGQQEWNQVTIPEMVKLLSKKIGRVLTLTMLMYINLRVFFPKILKSLKICILNSLKFIVKIRKSNTA